MLVMRGAAGGKRRCCVLLWPHMYLLRHPRKQTNMKRAQSSARIRTRFVRIEQHWSSLEVWSFICLQLCFSPMLMSTRGGASHFLLPPPPSHSLPTPLSHSWSLTKNYTSAPGAFSALGGVRGRNMTVPYNELFLRWTFLLLIQGVYSCVYFPLGNRRNHCLITSFSNLLSKVLRVKYIPLYRNGCWWSASARHHTRSLLDRLTDLR